MTTAINSASSSSAHPTTEPKADAIRFLDEQLASVPSSDIPEDFQELSRVFPVIVLVPKSPIEDEATKKEALPAESVTDLTDTMKVGSPMNAAKAWPKNSNATDAFEFGGVKGCLSTMEIHCNGRPVTLTSKEFKTLAYLIKTREG